MTTLSPAGSNTIRGIFSMILGGGGLTVSDAATKWLTESIPIGEILFVRSLVVACAIWLIVSLRGEKKSLRIGRLRNQAMRSVLAVSTTFLIVLSLANLPLNEVVAILFMGPIFIAVLATPVLGERVGRQRWLAVLIGFAGMLIMVRPGTAAFQLAALLPVAAALSASMRDLVTRHISTMETSTAILFYSMLAVMLAGLASAPFGWQPMDLRILAVTIFAGLMFGLGHYFIIEAFRYGEATVVAPYRYANLIWATVFGFLIWREIPSVWVLAGAPLVVGSGLYILLIERARQTRLRGRRRA
jgi:drug/metabolite transporter (DMT)-like permease